MSRAHTSFPSGAAFRRWLSRHHATETELLVRLFKVHARHRGMGYREALDEALCYGWIDGVRFGLDADSFLIRFSPRKKRSYWSDVNVRRIKELIAARRVRPAGLAAFGAHDERRAPRYSFETEPSSFDSSARKLFRANGPAWAYYQDQAPWYRRTTVHWVTRAKKPETRARRLAKLIACSAAGRRIDELSRPARK